MTDHTLFLAVVPLWLITGMNVSLFIVMVFLQENQTATSAEHEMTSMPRNGEPQREAVPPSLVSAPEYTPAAYSLPDAPPPSYEQAIAAPSGVSNPGNYSTEDSYKMATTNFG